MLNIEIKFLRRILQNYLQNKYLDILNIKGFNETHTDNKDILSTIKLLDYIKEDIKINKKSIFFLYKETMPNIKKSELNIDKVNNFLNFYNIKAKNGFDIYLYIIEKQIFSELNFLFAIFFLNLINYRLYCSIVVPLKNSYFLIDKYQKSNFEHLIKLEIEKIIMFSSICLKRKKVYSIDEICELIKRQNLRDYILYNIHSIAIFGSYAHNSYNNYSDIDLHIVLNNNYYELNQAAKNICKFFKNILKTEVDVITTIKGKQLSAIYKNIFLNEIEVLRIED